MEIHFKNQRLAKVMSTDANRTREYGAALARKLVQRLSELAAAPNLETMRALPGHCHELRENRDGQLAIDLTGNMRLVFAPGNDPTPRHSDGGLDWSGVTAIIVLEVTDYHGK